MVEVIIIVCLAIIFYVVLRRMPEVEKIEVKTGKKEQKGIVESMQNSLQRIIESLRKTDKVKKAKKTTKKIKLKDLFTAAEKKQLKGDLEGAERIYLRLATLKPKDAKIFESLGQIYYQKKEYNDAVLAYKAALNREKDNGFNYYNLAMSLYKLKKNNEACTCFEKSIQLNNRIGIRHVGFGMCLLRLGEARRAIKSFKTAIEIEPNNEKYQYLLKKAESKTKAKKMLKQSS